MNTNHEPYKVDVPQSVLDDLRERLERTRWADQIPGSGWSYGADRTYLQELVEYWKEGFDWRAVEDRVNAYPQFVATIDGQRIHYFHVRSNEPGARPLMLLHGWPSSSLEFLDVIDVLTDPVSHGGDPSDAFHVIVPSLPGFTFSGPTTEAGWHSNRVGDALVVLMEELGYDRYYVEGGDWGTTIGGHLGRAHADRVMALYLTDVWTTGLRPEDGEPTEEEAALAAEQEAYFATEIGYVALQGTKPQSLAYGLVDSPVALAAWLVEKYKAWTDNDGNVETGLSKDQMLATITAYWVTGTGGSSARIYFENGAVGLLGPVAERVEVPVAVGVFAKALYRTTRRIAEHNYNIVYWNELPAGGHFPAAEQPELWVNDLRAALKDL